MRKTEAEREKKAKRSTKEQENKRGGPGAWTGTPKEQEQGSSQPRNPQKRTNNDGQALASQRKHGKDQGAEQPKPT